MGHIAEEIRNPMATQIDAAIKQALVYEPYRAEDSAKAKKAFDA